MFVDPIQRGWLRRGRIGGGRVDGWLLEPDDLKASSASSPLRSLSTLQLSESFVYGLRLLAVGCTPACPAPPTPLYCTLLSKRDEKRSPSQPA